MVYNIYTLTDLTSQQISVLEYRKLLLISSGLVQLRKGFWLGFYPGELKGHKSILWEQADKNEVKDSYEECIVRKPLYLSVLYL